jgi:ATP-binding cassette subfamily F protein uup
VIGYLKDFLFTPDRANTRASLLSGGERNRLLLAKLFTKPSNVLVLDEPTNDLDMETLELLESLLVNYPGTLFLVSHDRTFLNNVVTSLFVFEGQGRVQEYVGGYDDWVRQTTSNKQKKESGSPAKTVQEIKKRTCATTRPPKLSFNQKRELASLPQQIETLEAEKKEIETRLADPSLMDASDPSAYDRMAQQLETIETTLESLYDRWVELSSIQED